MSTRLKENKSFRIRRAQDQRLHKGTYLLSLKTTEINDQDASPVKKKYHSKHSKMAVVA